MKGKTIKADVITGIDIFADVNGKESDEDFIQKNTGEGKHFPISQGQIQMSRPFSYLMAIEAALSYRSSSTSIQTPMNE